MNYKDYYKILGVDKKATQAEIKKRFRKLAVQYHPDKNPDDTAAESKFKEVNEAYEVLGDAGKRKKYDEMGANWKQYDRFNNAQGGQGRGQYKYQGEYGDFFGGSGGGFSDFFNAFFGGAGFGSPQGGFGSGSPFGNGSSLRRPANAKGRLNLTFEEAVNGVSKTIRVNGQGIKMTISAGARDGQKLKLNGKGPNGGDLIIELKVASDPNYKIDGRDLLGKAEVDFFTAALGGKAKVKTPRGIFTVNVAEGTDSGKRLRLKGKGMPDYGKSTHGDFIAEIKVAVPKNLSERERELLKELKELSSAKG